MEGPYSLGYYFTEQNPLPRQALCEGVAKQADGLGGGSTVGVMVYTFFN